MTDAQAAILARMRRGGTLTQSLHGYRLWSLLEDPFTVFDDLSPCQLRAAGLIVLAQAGCLERDRPDTYRLTAKGREAGRRAAS